MRKFINLTLAFVASLVVSTSLTAQDLDIDISKDGIDISTNEWYENPYLWAGAFAVVVLAVLVSRRKK